MPFESQAQRRKFAQLLVEGKISNDTFEEWNRETGGKKLKAQAGRVGPSGDPAPGEPQESPHLSDFSKLHVLVCDPLH